MSRVTTSEVTPATTLVRSPWTRNAATNTAVGPSASGDPSRRLWPCAPHPARVGTLRDTPGGHSAGSPSRRRSAPHEMDDQRHDRHNAPQVNQPARDVETGSTKSQATRTTMNSTASIPAPLSRTDVGSRTAAAVGPRPLTWSPARAGAKSVPSDSRPYRAPTGLGPLPPALSLSRLASVPLPLTAFWLLRFNPRTRRTRNTATSRGNALGLPENADQRLGAGEWAARATGATASSPSPHHRARTTRAPQSIRLSGPCFPPPSEELTPSPAPRLARWQRRSRSVTPSPRPSPAARPAVRCGGSRRRPLP